MLMNLVGQWEKENNLILFFFLGFYTKKPFKIVKFSQLWNTIRFMKLSVKNLTL